MICDICGRPLPDELLTCNRHHLIPKSKGGKEVILVHKICHNKIHSLWTENELAKYYHTIERIKSHSDMIKFIEWISKKEIEFYATTKDSICRKYKRKR
jgi:hypothetical protein